MLKKVATYTLNKQQFDSFVVIVTKSCCISYDSGIILAPQDRYARRRVTIQPRCFKALGLLFSEQSGNTD